MILILAEKPLAGELVCIKCGEAAQYTYACIAGDRYPVCAACSKTERWHTVYPTPVGDACILGALGGSRSTVCWLKKHAACTTMGLADRCYCPCHTGDTTS